MSATQGRSEVIQAFAATLPGLTHRAKAVTTGADDTAPEMEKVKMPFTKSAALTTASLAFLALAAHPVAAQTSIGIHFEGNNGSLVQGGAGAVVQTLNWNNLANSSGTSGPLVDTNNASTGTTITYSAPGVYKSGSPNQFPNQALMSGYLDTTDAVSTLAATVSNIGFSTYDVYAYVLGDTAGRTASYTIGSQTFYLQSADPHFPNSTFNQVTSTTAGTYTTGNYIEFAGVTGSSFTITSQAIGSAGQAMRAPLNGLQIVDETVSAAPEPSQIGVIALAAIGLGGLLLRVRKRTMSVA